MTRKTLSARRLFAHLAERVAGSPRVLVIAPADVESAARLGPLNCGVLKALRASARNSHVTLRDPEIFIEGEIHVDINRGP